MSDETPAGEVVEETPEKFPVSSLDEALPHLRRPFSPAAIKWKVQSSYPKDEPTTAVIIGYIDARLAVERLNLVVGSNWSEKPIRVEGEANALMYELTVFETTHIDVGVGQGRSEEMKLKARHSDALKRTAVRFGVGVSLYAIPAMLIPVTASAEERSDGTQTLGRYNSKPTKLRPAHFAWLRGQYEAWLASEAGKNFGDVLDHGDAPESAGELAEAAGTEEEAGATDAAPAVSPQQAAAITDLANACRERRDAIRALDADALPEASFDRGLAEREHSEERMQDFLRMLTELQGNIERFEELAVRAEGALSPTDFKALLGRAERRGSRAERVSVLEEWLTAYEAQEAGE